MLSGVSPKYASESPLNDDTEESPGVSIFDAACPGLRPCPCPPPTESLSSAWPNWPAATETQGETTTSMESKGQRRRMSCTMTPDYSPWRCRCRRRWILRRTISPRGSTTVAPRQPPPRRGKPSRCRRPCPPGSRPVAPRHLPLRQGKPRSHPPTGHR